MASRHQLVGRTSYRGWHLFKGTRRAGGRSTRHRRAAGCPPMPPAQNSVAWRNALGERSTNGQGGRDYENIADRYRADRGHRDCGGAGSGAWQQERSRGPGAARAAERAARQGHAGPFELPQCRASGHQGGSQCARTKDGVRGEEEIAGV